MSIWDSQEFSLAGFLIYTGLRHTALRTTVYLSGDGVAALKVSSLFLELQNLCRIQIGLTCSNLGFAANPISTLSGFFLIFLSKRFIHIKLYRFDFFFRTSFKVILPKKPQAKSPRVSAIKGSFVWKLLKNTLSLPETIPKNLSLVSNKDSWIILFKYWNLSFLPSGSWLFFKLQVWLINLR